MSERPTESEPSRPVLLARRAYAWAFVFVAVVCSQMIMWRGWNASGRWEPVAGSDAVVAELVYGATAGVPLVAALFLLRRWVSLGAMVVALLAIAVMTASFFETSSSSTAAFAWFGPLVYGLPLVALVAIAEPVGARLFKTAGGRRS